MASSTKDLISGASALSTSGDSALILISPTFPTKDATLVVVNQASAKIAQRSSTLFVRHTSNAGVGNQTCSLSSPAASKPAENAISERRDAIFSSSLQIFAAIVKSLCANPPFLKTAGGVSPQLSSNSSTSCTNCNPAAPAARST